MIPSAHIDRSYHGLLRGKERPCVRCGHNYKIAAKRFHSKFLFRVHRIGKRIDNGPLPKVPVIGGILATAAKTAAIASMIAHQAAVERKKALVKENEPEGEVIYLNQTIGGRDD